MTHDTRLVRHEEQIEELRKTIPEWIRNLERPPTPMLVPKFGPLAGIRVVSTGIVIAQPWTGTKMAMFGAEVIHVERPGGDIHRRTAPNLVRGKRVHGCDWANEAVCRLSMGLNFKDPKGLELLMALWKISDVWMESSAPGTLERSGITPELALAVNPKLVILRVCTYGQYGDEQMLGRPGYDALGQAFGGLIAVTGDEAGPPQRAKVYTADYLTALHGWAAVMMALWHARETGQGQVIDNSQYEAVHVTMGFQMPWISGEGKYTTHKGNKAPGFQPYDTFECKDGHVFIGALGPIIYSRVPGFLGLDPEEYSYENCSLDEAAVYSEKGLELDAKLREYCKNRTKMEVEKAFNAAQIGCCRVMNAEDMLKEPHFRMRETHVPVVDRQSGVPVRVGGITPKLSLTPGQVWRGAPAIGEDTTNIMTKILGFSEEEALGYYASGITHRTEPFEEPVVEPLEGWN
ncbi:MAG: CoA transferase [Deltaproteobacteria bacterium]|nr:CoA transferase [Deltaproteobacteria bacterium]